MMRWLRARAEKREQPPARHCIGCRAALAGRTDDGLRASGASFLEGAGWLCGARCEYQYRLRFRIQPTGTPPAGVPRRTTGSLRAVTPPVGEPIEKGPVPEREITPAADALAAALRARRQKRNGGFR